MIHLYEDTEAMHLWRNRIDT